MLLSGIISMRVTCQFAIEARVRMVELAACTETTLTITSAAVPHIGKEEIAKRMRLVNQRAVMEESVFPRILALGSFFVCVL